MDGGAEPVAQGAKEEGGPSPLKEIPTNKLKQITKRDTEPHLEEEAYENNSGSKNGGIEEDLARLNLGDEKSTPSPSNGLRGTWKGLSANDSIVNPLALVNTIGIGSLQSVIYYAWIHDSEFSKAVDNFGRVCCWITEAFQESRNKAPNSLFSMDEKAAVGLYTLPQGVLFHHVNSAMRSEEAKRHAAWYPYLQLLRQAVCKVPCLVGTVWRGIDLDTELEKGDIQDWWGITSTSASLSCIETFCSDAEYPTVVQIHAKHLFDITHLSCADAEQEYLLMPGARVEVVGVIQVNGVQIVEVRELNSHPFEQWGPIWVPDKNITNKEETIKPSQNEDRNKKKEGDDPRQFLEKLNEID